MARCLKTFAVKETCSTFLLLITLSWENCSSHMGLAKAWYASESITMVSVEGCGNNGLITMVSTGIWVFHCSSYSTRRGVAPRRNCKWARRFCSMLISNKQYASPYLVSKPVINLEPLKLSPDRYTSLYFISKSVINLGLLKLSDPSLWDRPSLIYGVNHINVAFINLLFIFNFNNLFYSCKDLCYITILFHLSKISILI